jgi:RecB family exonuclease
MIKQAPTLDLKQMSSISPSQLNRLDGCALQVVMQKCYPEGMLPPVAMSYFGNVTHKVIEQATKGELTDEPAIQTRFDVLIAEAETSLTAKGWTHLVPLKRQVTDFAPRRKQAIRRALSLVPTQALTTGVSSGSYQTEQRFESACRRVVGYIDAIRKTSAGVEIVDYKSGQIMDETGLNVKPAYRQQLWLYAYLYWERHGAWPIRLSLIGLTGPAVDVPYTPIDTTTTFQQAVSQLEAINWRIADADWPYLTNGVDSTTCSYCPVRPACPTYTIVPGTKGYSDVAGLLTTVRQLINGTLLIQLTQAGQTCTITNVPDKHLLTLNGLEGQVVSINTTRPVSENRYEWLGQTVLFWA